MDFEDTPDSSPRPKASHLTLGGGFRGGAFDPLRGEPVAEDWAPREPREVDLSFLDNLNDKQREAVLITEGPLIVLAGAGSGKTSMLTSRIAYLIHTHRAWPSEILAMTFTNKAAGEMRERVQKLLARQGSSALGSPEIGTFHSVCVRLLRRELHATPFTKPFVIYDTADQLSLLKTVCKQLSIDEQAFNPKSFQAAIDRLKCDAVEAHEIDPTPHNLFEKKLKEVYAAYQKELFKNNALDFGEIICMVWRIFRDRPEIRAKYQKRFRYIHVDEYQDTNRAQYLLLSALASKTYGGHGNICVVGDEDQSIYKWRGADIGNILDFERDYPGASVVKLEQNYRSTKNIIRAAGQVIANNTQRKDKTLWTENVEGLPIVWYQVPDERVEAETVVREIQRLASTESLGYGDFAIFYRTNAQSRQFEDLLRRDKIAYQIVGGLKFYDRKEIKDMLAYFRVVMNPSDSVSLKRIINSPARGIGKTTIEKLEMASQASQASLWDTLASVADGQSNLFTGATLKKLVTFQQTMLKVMKEQPKLLVSELYHLLLDETRYVSDLRQEGTEEALARIENLEEFDTLIQEFEEEMMRGVPDADKRDHASALLPEFLERSALASDADTVEAALVSVKMMTLHSSKGLEYPAVFLVGMEEGLFPSIRPWEEEGEADVEEERRLAYVGMTRARKHLYLLSAQSRRTWGNVHFRDPSRFIREVPSDLLLERDLTQSRAAAQSAKLWGDAPSGSSSGYAGGGKMQTLIGRAFLHPEYGRGKVIGVEDDKVVVEFSGRNRRKFVYRYVASYIDAD